MKRECSGCQLCCKLLAVVALDKPNNTRCKHQKFRKGCGVYNTSAMPRECSFWNCRWLVNDDTAALPRPDRAHYVIDIMPDHITLENNDTGESYAVEVIQIWVDDAMPYGQAHHEPALREYLVRQGKHGKAALFRHSDRRTMIVFPPTMTNGAGWVEVPHDAPNAQVTRQHSFADTVQALGNHRVTGLVIEP